MRSLPALFLIVCVAHGASGAAAPQARGERPVPSPITDHFSLRGSFFGASLATDLRLDSQAGTPGTLLSAEDDLGLDDRDDQVRVELLFRLGERNRLRVDYFKTSREAARDLTRQIAFGDDTFLVGDRLLTEIDWRMLGLTYTFSPLRFERFELGAGLGAYLIEAQARGEVPARFIGEEASGVGAFPTLALDGTWRISRRFALTARGQYFSASVDELDGSLADYHLDVQYRWKPNVAVGLGYSMIDADLDIRDTDFPGLFSLEADGPELFFRVSF